ncbi:MAG: hypothetical protein A2Y33_14370 [Spirochaetes bacterium GWF1_51_8]|nr:MAG: hypothetical protein A2Y33_14370 [Spirochaetes bacterium GWF1_51_8]
MIPKIIQAVYNGDFRIRIKFEDGAEGVVDFKNELYGVVFEPLKDDEYFKSFQIRGSSLCWENGADFAPEFLYESVKSPVSVKA